MQPSAVGAPIGAPRVEEAVEQSSESELARRYHLLLLDDDHHSYAYVIEMLGAIFGYGREKAFALARIVDTAGQVIVQTGSHDEVTRNQVRIHGYGADPRIPTSRGSMSAIVEEAE
jgi:ATP-dependent Clp protease adaptor protein ClpS